MSPEIVDINERIPASMVIRPLLSQDEEEEDEEEDEDESYESSNSKSDESFLPHRRSLVLPQLELNIHSEPMTDWFAHDTVRTEALGGSHDKLDGSGSVSGSGLGAEGTRSDRSREASESEQATNQLDEVRLNNGLQARAAGLHLVLDSQPHEYGEHRRLALPKCDPTFQCE
jgi:hypothetical protein